MVPKKKTPQSKKKYPLSEAEWVVMTALWRAGTGASLREIRENLERLTDRSDSTIQTLLKRIVAKGYAMADLSGGRLRHTPTITHEQAIRMKIHEFVEVYLGGDKQAIAHLIEIVKERGEEAGLRRGKRRRRRRA